MLTRLWSRDITITCFLQLAILGKPNVGKSALFNRLVQRSEALVSSHDATSCSSTKRERGRNCQLTPLQALSQVKNTPDDHVTRDYRTARGKLGDLSFRVVDTSGTDQPQTLYAGLRQHHNYWPLKAGKFLINSLTHVSLHWKWTCRAGAIPWRGQHPRQSYERHHLCHQRCRCSCSAH